MKMPRHLNTIGIDHRDELHHLFDDDGSMSNHATTAVVPSNTTELEFPIADPSNALSEMESENRQRAITMSALFSVLMILYIGFCCYYQKLTKVRQRIGDSARGRSANGNREERRDANRAVLDESSSAAQRAARDEEMGRKLEERRRRIRSALAARMVAEEDFAGMPDDAGRDEELASAGGSGEPSGKEGDGSSDRAEKDAADTDIVPDFTLSTSDETQDSLASHDRDAAASAAPDAISAKKSDAASSSTFARMDFKRCTEAFHSSLSNCSNTAQHCSAAHNGNNGACFDSAHRSDRNTALLSTLNDEECNICLSNFQVGDRIAWSRKNRSLSSPGRGCGGGDASKESGDAAADGEGETACRHVFHAECIERWLLVREGCPVCRRSYFEDENAGGDVGANGTEGGAIGNGSSRRHPEEVVDLERGEDRAARAPLGVIVGVED